MEDKHQYARYNQCHGCWWLGDARGLGVRGHVVDPVIAEYSCFSTSRDNLFMNYFRLPCIDVLRSYITLYFFHKCIWWRWTRGKPPNQRVSFTYHFFIVAVLPPETWKSLERSKYVVDNTPRGYANNLFLFYLVSFRRFVIPISFRVTSLA